MKTIRTRHLTASLILACSAIFIGLSDETLGQSIVYNNTSVSGGRFRSGSGMFDDVLIPVSTFLPSVSEVPITSITFGMNLFDVAGTGGNFDIYWGAMESGIRNGIPQPVPTGPRNLIGNFADWDSNAVVNELFEVNIGNGVDPLFTLDSSNVVQFEGIDYFAFVVGQAHNSARSGTGWLPVLASDFNLRSEDANVGEGIFGWSNSNNTWSAGSGSLVGSGRETFYMTITTSAAVVPEPMATGLLMTGVGLVLLGRKRKI